MASSFVPAAGKQYSTERGITSTGWRDYVDIVELSRKGIENELLPAGEPIVPPTPTADYRPDPRQSNRAPGLCVRDHDRRKRGHDPRRSARAVTHHRGVVLGPVAPHLVGYGEVGQAKWAAWRRKEHLESVCEENLDDQAELVASYLDPIFILGPG
ncbi:hypothetical protein A4X20_24475 [Mycolicibacterium iranicum]|uniref:Uncharacterized protein n=1 Tax=Mycolicibacterium iranicum TaxID=912594 RepID=A0A178LRT2_MYCIR|nr:hypothetical protein A4X20_24475 [Mycolicibacterium iranicum]